MRFVGRWNGETRVVDSKSLCHWLLACWEGRQHGGGRHRIPETVFFTDLSTATQLDGHLFRPLSYDVTNFNQGSHHDEYLLYGLH